MVTVSVKDIITINATSSTTYKAVFEKKSAKAIVASVANNTNGTLTISYDAEPRTDANSTDALILAPDQCLNGLKMVGDVLYIVAAANGKIVIGRGE